MVFPHYRVFSNANNKRTDTHANLGHVAKGRRPVTKEHRLYDSTHRKSRIDQPIETEMRLVVTGAKGMGEKWEWLLQNPGFLSQVMKLFRNDSSDSMHAP